MRFVRLLAALTILMCAGQVDAAKIFTVTGTVAPGPYGYSEFTPAGALPPATSSFTYGFHISFSAPVTGEFNGYSQGVYEYIDRAGNVIGGNTIEGMFESVWLDGERSATLRSTAPAISIGNGIHRVETSFWGGADGTLYDLEKPVTYTMSGFASVPEPATWGLMIMGFGAIGAAMRRKVRVQMLVGA